MSLTSQVREQLLEVVPFADRGDDEAAWEAARPLLSGWRTDVDVAAGLALLVGHRRLNRDRRLQLAEQLLAEYPLAVEVLYGLGSAAEGLWGQRFLNAAPPSEPVFRRIVGSLRTAIGRPLLHADKMRLAEVLASSAAVVGRAGDPLADYAHRTLLKGRRRARWEDWYNYGLFLKSRGRWLDSLQANRSAVAKGGGADESVRWNLGIAATAAGRGDVAMQVWRDLGQDVRPGPSGLPEGPYEPVQVRLAERPVAERGDGAVDSPGLEEAIWVERVSPCHGVVRGEPQVAVGVHFGDVVLFDGTPLYHRPWNGHAVPVFGHLTTLYAGGYRIYALGGIASHRRQVAGLIPSGEHQVVPCVHRERAVELCIACFDGEGEHVCSEGYIVRGVLCVAPDQDLGDTLRVLDERVQAVEDGQVRLVVPDLLRDIGDDAAADKHDASMASLDKPCEHLSG